MTKYGWLHAFLHGGSLITLFMVPFYYEDMLMLTYVPSGVCSKRIEFDIKDGNLSHVAFEGGCPGNLEGISRLVEGLPVDDVITRLQGITCGKKTTSCPDQLTLALGEWKQANS